MLSRIGGCEIVSQLSVVQSDRGTVRVGNCRFVSYHSLANGWSCDCRNLVATSKAGFWLCNNSFEDGENRERVDRPLPFYGSSTAATIITHWKLFSRIELKMVSGLLRISRSGPANLEN